MNIILIMSDTFRFDNLFDRSPVPVDTPNLDAFAGRAAEVIGMHVGSFPTIPQRTDMTSGRIGWPWYAWQALELSTKNHLPRILGEAGYVSQLLCDCPHLFKANFQTGFSAAHRLRGQEGDIYFTRMNYPIEHVMPPEKTRTGRHFQGHNLIDLHCWTNRNWSTEADRFPPRTAALATEWLDENYRHHPFFLWVDFFDPHEPWDPPEEMVRKYDPDYSGTPMLHPNYGRADDLTPAELRNLRAHYCAESELVDRHVGKILDKINELGLWDSTIVVFTADHGHSVGEHNRTGKSNISDGDDRYWPIYPEVSRVPFLAAAPGVQGGLKVQTIAQPADILPTLLDLAGLDVSPPEPLHGRSLAPLLRGQSTEPIRELTVAASFPGGLREGENRLRPKSVTPVLYTSQWAYVPVGAEGECELYDLRSDAYAETNVAGGNGVVVGALHEKFVAYMKDLNAPEACIEVFK